MHPDTARLSEFAGILGVSSSYVTALKGADRLVLTDDGKRVRVAESLARIEATEDPSKRGVAARHAAARAPGATVAVADAAAAHTSTDVAPVAASPRPPGKDLATSSYQQARADRERYAAMQARLDYERAIGKLLDVDQVVGAVANAGVTLRQHLENLPDALAPRLVVLSDEKSIRAILREEIENALAELARQFAAIGKAA